MEDLQLKIARSIINVNNIEAEINDVIANYYTKQEGVDCEESYFNILGDIIQTRHLGLNAKREILVKILKRTDNLEKFNTRLSVEKFKRWVEIRNIFAHGEVMSFNGNDSIRFNGFMENPNDLFREISELNKRVMAMMQDYDLYSRVDKTRTKARMR